MKRLIFIFLLFVLGTSLFANEKEVIIRVPSEMTVEMIVADEHGLINGTRHVRARIYDPHTLERIWFEDYQAQTIEDGAFVLTMNSIPSLNAYALHKKELKLVVSIDDQPVEIPLLTEFYSYRSLFAEFGWDTRFPSIIYIDRNKNYLGIGMESDRLVKGHVDVRGALKLAYEDTQVTGAIRWVDNSMWIKHPNEWVDLLYGPTTFKKSRWTGFSQHIQLTSANYRIGIGVEFPQEKLHVIGTAAFSGGLNASSLNANAFKINTMELNDTALKLSSLSLKDAGNVMEWTSDNLRVPFGQISGDGSGLMNVGQDLKDFDNQMIQHSHLDGAVVSSRNLQLQAIEGNHLADYTLLLDRFVLGVFNGDTIGDNQITSDNFMIESLTFDMLITNNVQEYIPDGFFMSAKIASDSVFETKIKDQSIASYNIKSNIFTESQFEDNIILGDTHITPNSVVVSKFKTGEIKPSLFSGLIGFPNGGTGIGSLTPDRILVVGDSAFKANTNMLINSLNNVGLFKKTILSSLQKNYQYPLNVESLDGAVGVAVREAAAKQVQFGMVIPSSTLNLTLNSAGPLTFDLDTHQLVLHKTQGLSTNPSNSQEQLDLGSAITIGDASNSQPSGGTMEYEAANARFRFYDGSNWKLITNYGFGIGTPIAKNHHVQVTDSFIGSSQDSTGVLDRSFVGTIDESSIHGRDFTIGSVIGSQIDGQSLYLDRIHDSRISSQSMIGHQLDASKVFVTGGKVSHISSSSLTGRAIAASNISNANIDAKKAALSNVNEIDAVLKQTMVKNVSNATIVSERSLFNNNSDMNAHGEELLVQHSTALDIQGAWNDVSASQFIQLLGDSNALTMAEDAQLVGNQNMVLSAKDVLVRGDGNRVFGSSARVDGKENLIIGSDVSVVGDGNIAINASTKPMHVDGDDKVVLSAPNGVFIHTGDGMVVAATDVSGGWGMVSDKTLKTGFENVNHQQMFQSLMTLPITQWEYIFKKGVHHIGPMAQDFKSAFNIGEDERFITSSDADGVAFSAIKYLISVSDQMTTKRSGLLPEDFDQIEKMLTDINGIMDQLDHSMKMKKAALDVMVDKNLEQYQMIDNQLKTLARYNTTPSTNALLYRSLKVFFILLLSLLLGFYALRLYHKKER